MKIVDFIKQEHTTEEEHIKEVNLLHEMNYILLDKMVKGELTKKEWIKMPFDELVEFVFGDKEL